MYIHTNTITHTNTMYTHANTPHDKMLDWGAEVLYGETFLIERFFFWRDTYVYTRKRCWTRARRFFIPTPCGSELIASMSMSIPIFKMVSINMDSKVSFYTHTLIHTYTHTQECIDPYIQDGLHGLKTCLSLSLYTHLHTYTHTHSLSHTPHTK